MVGSRDKIEALIKNFTAAKTVSVRHGSLATTNARQLLEGFCAVRRKANSRAFSISANFGAFLKGWQNVCALSRTGIAQKAAAFAALIGDFQQASIRSAIKSAEIAARRKHVFQVLVESFAATIESWEKTQREKADRFYILDVLDLMRHEESHSRVLAWLLDRNYRKLGTHAQGSLGLRLFLQALALPNAPTTWADELYSVRREISGKESRIDIEVAARGRFLIHIEVKIGASEGHQQTTREWNDLCRRATELNVRNPSFGGDIVAFFVTPSGALPSDRRFIAVSWRKIAQVLGQFADEAQSNDVKVFARHYANTLLSRIVTTEQEESEDINGGTEI